MSNPHKCPVCDETVDQHASHLAIATRMPEQLVRTRLGLPPVQTEADSDQWRQYDARQRQVVTNIPDPTFAPGAVHVKDPETGLCRVHGKPWPCGGAA